MSIDSKLAEKQISEKFEIMIGRPQLSPRQTPGSAKLKMRRPLRLDLKLGAMKLTGVGLITTAILSSALAQGATTKVLIAYHSQSGHTRSMALAVAEGAGSINGVETRLLRVQDVKQDHLLEADAIIVGSPVLNANVAPEVQAFINSWPFEGRFLQDKVGAAFASGGGISAGEEAVQLSILRSMLVFGMIIVGGPNWMSAFGASAVTEEDIFAADSADGKVAASFLEKARALGRRVAQIAAKLKNADSNSPGSRP